MSTQPAALNKPDQQPEMEPAQGPSPVSVTATKANENNVRPYRKRLFFHFEIGVKRTMPRPDRAAEAQAAPSEHTASITQPVLAFSSMAPMAPVAPIAPMAPMALKPAVMMPVQGAAPVMLSGSSQAGSGSGSGSSTSTNAGYLDLSVGIATETPPNSSGGPVGWV